MSQTILIGLAPECISFYNEKFLKGLHSEKDLKSYPGMYVSSTHKLSETLLSLQDNDTVVMKLVNWHDLIDLKQSKQFIFCPLMVWDYTNFVDKFQKTLDIPDVCINDKQILLWNMDKSYLKDLEEKGLFADRFLLQCFVWLITHTRTHTILGIPIVPTIFVDSIDQAGCDEAFEKFDSDIVIKPSFGANAFSQLLLKKNNSLPPNKPNPENKSMLYPTAGCKTLIQKVRRMFGGKIISTVLFLTTSLYIFCCSSFQQLFRGVKYH
jgi:hypothetical protein